MNLKKLNKKIKKQQELYQNAIRAEQAHCPHVSKKGKTKLVEFTDEGIRKGRCKRCGEVVILDRELLSKDSLEMSTNIVKTALAELRAAVHIGKIELDDRTLETITRFDSEVLRELPQAMAQMTEKSGGKKKNKDKKKKKKENKRRRWN
jgi:hypothetical protein